MIGVVDYGVGNVKSIINMFKKLGFDVKLVNTSEQIKGVDHLVLPGVGSFDYGMHKLLESGLIDAIKNHVLLDCKPILGICLGMQMLGARSEEGNLKGLGFIPFSCKKFEFKIEDKLKVPHMGWNIVNSNQVNDRLTSNLDVNQRYYFVHSYYAECENIENILMTCEYGHTFTAAVRLNKIYGVQFHPEKSHKFGMKLLENFARL